MILIILNFKQVWILISLSPLQYIMTDAHFVKKVMCTTITNTNMVRINVFYYLKLLIKITQSLILFKSLQNLKMIISK